MVKHARLLCASPLQQFSWPWLLGVMSRWRWGSDATKSAGDMQLGGPACAMRADVFNKKRLYRLACCSKQHRPFPRPRARTEALLLSRALLSRHPIPKQCVVQICPAACSVDWPPILLQIRALAWLMPFQYDAPSRQGPVATPAGAVRRKTVPRVLHR